MAKRRTRRRGWIGRAGAPAAACVLAAAAFSAGLAGCATYANWPAIGGDVAVNDPNVHPLPTLAVFATTNVVRADRRDGLLPEAWVFNPPGGTDQVRARRMLGEIEAEAGVSGGMLVGDAGWENTPVYSVTRVWLRGSEARVDVVRPVGVPAVEGGLALQRVTLDLRHGGPGRTWRVERRRTYRVGGVGEPVIFGWPEPEQEPEPRPEVPPMSHRSGVDAASAGGKA